MITDMTVGKPSGVLWKFTIPMLVSVMFQQMYNIVDSIVAGKFVGVNALAAVGASYPITMIFMAVATGLNIGCSVVISLYFGAKEYKQMKSAVSTSLLTVLGISVLLTVLGLIFSRPLMVLLKTPGDIFGDSALYLNIYIGGLIFLFLYNICTGVFTALGDSRTPLYFLIASSLGNIVLDLVFVINFHMGVSGVAWATFLAQGLSSLLAFLTLRKRLKAVESPKYKLFSGSMLKKDHGDFYTKHPAAELYLRWKSVCTGVDQQLWFCGGSRVFCRNEDQYLCNHVFYNAGKMVCPALRRRIWGHRKRNVWQKGFRSGWSWL